jgi:hypothetical protein
MVAQKFDATRELEAAARILFSRWTLALPTAFASLAIAAIVFFVIGAVVVSGIAALLVGNGGALAALWAGASTVVFAAVAITLISTGREPDFDAATIHLPGVGLLTAFFVGGLTAAYIALVEVRFYAMLRSERVSGTALQLR